MGKLEEEHFGLSDGEENSLPTRSIDIGKFYMGRFEITNRQWNIVAKLPKKYIDLEATEIKADENSLPKTNVSYSKAKEFCERLSADLSSQVGRTIIVRLPTEAEWEYACRAGTLTSYGGGNEFDWEFINAKYIIKEASAGEIAILNKLQNKSLPDSSFIANPFGLAAMNGNVWEMVSDSWHANYKNAPLNSLAWEPIDINSGDKSKSYVLRGGAFNRPNYMCQCSYRTNGTFSTQGNEQTGFRIVLEAKSVD
jgi:formylglycine-generating enzyme required for sulfatase activity